MEEFLSKIWTLVSANPIVAVLVAVAFLFFMKNDQNQSWLSLLFNKVKGAASSVSKGSATTAEQQCRTAEGRVAVLVHLCRHCEACGDTEAAEHLRSALSVLMKDSSSSSFGVVSGRNPIH